MYTSWMTKSYTLASARAQLSALVDDVAEGNDVELTRRGKPVAVLVSAAKYARLHGDAPAFATAFARFKQRFDLPAIGIEADWAEGLRDRGRGRRVAL